MNNIENVGLKHLDGPPKKIGSIDGKDLFQAKTKGGLFMLVTKKNNGFNIISSGPHRAIARHIAQKNNENVIFTELSKSDHIDLDQYEMVIKEYEEITTQMRKANKDE